MKVYYFGVTQKSIKEGNLKWLTNVVNHSEFDTKYLIPTRLIWNKVTIKMPQNPFLKMYLEKIVDGDLLHVISQWGPSKQAAYKVKCNKIITIHDLFDREGNTDQLVSELTPYISDYEAVFVPSKFTYEQVCNFFPNVESVIQIIPNCVDADLFRPLSLRKEEIIRLMYVGTEKPSKNIPLLLEAFSEFKKRVGKNLKLIKVGRPSQGQRGSVIKLSRELGIESDILWIDWVPDNELVRLYNLADVYIQPSKCEGFGVPVIEAMACGTPVVANNSSSLPEVIGNAGLLFDDSVESLVDTLHRVCLDSKLKEELSRRGRDRVLKMFTPDRISKMMLNAYEDLLKK